MPSQLRFARLRAGVVQTGLLLRVFAGLTILVCVAAVTGLWMANRAEQISTPVLTPVEDAPAQPTGPKPGTVGGIPIFAGWPKAAPDLVLVISGQSFGYLQPCGCSRPQLGGLERRYNFMQALRAKGWNVVGLDVGDIAPGKSLKEVTAQSLQKYKFSMKALAEMGYAAVGLGTTDFAQQLNELIGQFALNNENKRPFLLSANIEGVVKNAVGNDFKKIKRVDLYPASNPKERPLVEAFEVVEDPKVPFVVMSLVAASVASEVMKADPSLDFGQQSVILKQTLADSAKHPSKPDLKVLLYQGTEAEAKVVAKDFPEIQLIVCIGDASEPPQFPTLVNDKKTQIVTVGHKGRYIGAIGIFKTANGLDLRYQLVPMDEQYLTPEAVKDNTVLNLLEEYAAVVKKDDFLAKAVLKRNAHAASIKNPTANLKYIGSDACAACHAAEYKVWKSHPHSHAYEALEKKATRPGLRNFDPECLSCHTTGFDYDTGFKNNIDTPLLLNNGCENCHGPGSGHAEKPKNKQLNDAMMPWRLNENDKLPSKEYMEKMGKLDQIQRGSVEVPAAQQRLVNTISGMCMKCHDGDNDPKFDFYQYMPKLYHSGLKAQGLPGGAK